MTSLPRLHSDHKTRATRILQVFLQKSALSPGKLSSCCPAEESCTSRKAPQWPINRNCSLNLTGHHPRQLRRPGWRPSSLWKALNPPLQFRLPLLSHWKVLHAFAAKMGQQALMVLFEESLQNAWDWAVPPSWLRCISLGKPFTEYYSCLCAGGGDTNMSKLSS